MDGKHVGKTTIRSEGEKSILWHVMMERVPHKQMHHADSSSDGRSQGVNAIG